MGNANDLHIVGKFRILTQKAENLQPIAEILQQFKIKSAPFQGRLGHSFEIEPYELDHLPDQNLEKLADAVFFAGGHFQGVGTDRLNKISAEARKKCHEEGIPLPT